MADVDKRWAAIDALAQRGSASGYEQAVRAMSALAEGYALTSSRKEFDRALRRLLVRHATRGALLSRLTEAGLSARALSALEPLGCLGDLEAAAKSAGQLIVIDGAE